MFLVSTGALQAIPSELQEAAKIDGARNFQVFRLVNLPLLLVALTPLLVASFAFNFNNFNIIYLLTGGLPKDVLGGEQAGGTDILISYAYQAAINNPNAQDFGMASAISMLAAKGDVGQYAMASSPVSAITWNSCDKSPPMAPLSAATAR